MDASQPSLVDRNLLDKIDKLFACGVGNHVALPQLVVVGDQSSGKSSVLEGLTKLPFPRDSTLCTRFATQVTFRRAPSTSVIVTILKSKASDSQHADLRTYKREFRVLDGENFAKIMTEVKDLMGIGTRSTSQHNTSFSDHVLKIEVIGPEEEHFSVIDVPGIFEKTTNGITTKSDIAMVKSMVEGYMSNPRSVMLVVVPANVDIATQRILTMAEDADVDGHRTLGVLTKPDLVDAGAEQHVLDLVEGKSHRLNLGWCIVRNPGQQQLQQSGLDRTELEHRFFQKTPPWSALPEDRVGIPALRLLLRDICASHIRREFPKVKAEINKKLVASKHRLERLGSRREGAEEQRQYLLQLCMEFQEVTTAALAANYSCKDWFDQQSSLRLVTAVISRSETLSKAIHEYGHLHTFEGSEDRVDQSEALKRFTLREANPDLLEVFYEGHYDAPTEGRQIIDWLTKVYKSSRGFELGTFDGSLLATTMKVQSMRWEGFALGYISDVTIMVHAYITDLLRLVCRGNSRVYHGLMSLLMEPLLEKYKAARSHVQFLLHVERQGTPATMNHYFNSNLQLSRQKRLCQGLERSAVSFNPPSSIAPVFGSSDSNPFGQGAFNFSSTSTPASDTVAKPGRGFHNESYGKEQRSTTPTFTTAKKYIALDDLAAGTNMSNVEHMVQDLHDILRSYYKVAMKRFVDNVHMQAADYNLVTGPKTPLKIFNPAMVNLLTTEQLEDIAGEEAGARKRRETVLKEIADLEAGRKILF